MALAAGSLAAAFGCASAPHHDATVANAPAQTASSDSKATSSAAAKGELEQAAFTEDSDGARLVLSADTPILYTAYEPRPDLLVLDLPGFAVDAKFVAPSASGDLVQSVRFEPIQEMGKSLTRVSIAHREGARYDVRSLGQGLAVAFEAPAVASAAPAPAPAPAPAAVETSAPPPVAVASLPPAAAAPASRPASRVEIGHALEDVTASPSGEGVVVSLLGDGALAAKDFVLSNPPRIVVDLPGVKNEVRRRVVPVQSAAVTRVRISQFQTQPEPVTRIVVDLTGPTAYRLHADGERLAVLVGASAPELEASLTPPPATTASAPANAPVSEKLVSSERSEPAAAVESKPAASSTPASVTRVATVEELPPAGPIDAPPAPPIETASVAEHALEAARGAASGRSTCSAGAARPRRPSPPRSCKELGELRRRATWSSDPAEAELAP